MSKKKKRKDKDDNKKGRNPELTGLLLILISIIGFGKFGIVGEIISGFSIFLAGSWWVIALILVFVAGAYMTIKRDNINIFSHKLVGMYLIILGVLVLSHMDYVIVNKLDISSTLKDTLDQLILALKVSIDANGVWNNWCCFCIVI
jgi:S-DNA-T family DNA segregation ATPase FtsK/SpoIIIE